MAERSDRVLLAIAIFKLVKALGLIVIGVITLLAIDNGASDFVRWLSHLRIDPTNRYVHGALRSLMGASTHTLEAMSAGTFVYAAVFLVEGTGLLFRKRWAEYLTAVVTASFIPFEIYEAVHRLTVVKPIAIAVNVAVLVYLIVKLRRDRHERHHAGSEDS